MVKILFTLSITFITTMLYAQQIPINSQYMFSDFLINPSITGTLEHTPITLS